MKSTKAQGIKNPKMVELLKITAQMNKIVANGGKIRINDPLSQQADALRAAIRSGE